MQSINNPPIKTLMEFSEKKILVRRKNSFQSIRSADEYSGTRLTLQLKKTLLCLHCSAKSSLLSPPFLNGSVNYNFNISLTQACKFH